MKLKRIDQPQAKTKLLAYSDSVTVQTGFGVVSKYVLEAIRKSGHYDIHQLAINHYDLMYDRVKYPYEIIPARIGNPHDPYGKKMFFSLLSANKYDNIWIMNDIPVAQDLTDHLYEYKLKRLQSGHPVSIIYYYPIDCHLPYGKTDMLKLADRSVCYTNFGAQETQKFGFKPTDVIYLGTDTSLFRPCSAEVKKEIRARYFNIHDPDTFIWINVNRNSMRKNVSQTLQAFAQFKKEVKNSVLYLHMAMVDGGGAGGLDVDLRIPIQELKLTLGQDVRFPSNFHPAHGCSPEALARLYGASDAYITTTLGEGWGCCLDPQTLISTLDGPIKIKNIKIGYFVLSEDGRFHRVLNISSKQDSVFYLGVTGHPKIQLTDNHPLLSLKGCTKSGRKKRFARLRKQQHSPKWRQAKDLQVGDLIATVKPKLDELLPKEIDLVNWIDGIEYDQHFCWMKMGYSPYKNGLSIADIRKKYHVSKRVAEDARRCLLKQSLSSRGKKSSLAYSIAEQIANDKLTVNNSLVKVNRFIPVNSDFLQLVGWYLAEGSNNKERGLEISLHAREYGNVAQRLQTIIKKLFGIRSEVDQKGNASSCWSSSAIIARFFGKYCGVHAPHKQINQELFRAGKYLLPLVAAVLQGDGCIKNGKITFSSTSRSLTWQIREILLSHSIYSTIHEYKKPKKGNFPKWTLGLEGNNYNKLASQTNLPQSYLVHKRKRAEWYLETDNYYFVRINSIGQKSELQTVMDLSVDQVHSFSANGIIVHNSVTDALAAKIPVVAPLHSSFVEILGETRGYTYPCRESVYIDCGGYRPQGRIEDILAAMKKCYLERGTSQQSTILEQGRKFVELYSWEEVGKIWRKLMAEVDMARVKSQAAPAQLIQGEWL